MANAEIILQMLVIGSVTSARIFQRHIGIQDVFTPVSVHDLEVKEIATFVADTLAANSDSGPIQLAKIIKAESQTSGICRNFKMTLKFTIRQPSNYREEFTCDVIVLAQLLTKTRELKKSFCQARVVSKDIAPDVEEDSVVVLADSTAEESYSPVDVNNLEVEEMADFATTAISSYSNGGPVNLIKIVEAERQVVAGQNYKMTLEVSVGDNNTPYTCEVIVFDQKWSNTRQLTHLACPNSPL